MTFKYNKMPVFKPIIIPTKDVGSWKAFKRFFRTRRWQLNEDFVFKINNRWCSINAGFEFDGASVPRPFWPILSPTGILLIGGLIHDYGYKYRDIPFANGNGSIYNNKKRKTYDKLMLDISNQVNGINHINSFVYNILRAFGWIAWNKHRKNELV